MGHPIVWIVFCDAMTRVQAEGRMRGYQAIAESVIAELFQGAPKDRRNILRRLGTVRFFDKTVN